ncbi:nuA3 HAT complex component nto1 [Linnemannia zychae]|nr:nuA3 HAT complex component nto1 [Linnemannia zychae]
MFSENRAVPHSSPVFACILPGCTNSYQTKQGLERHFVSIHLPKPNVKPVTIQEPSSTSSGSASNTDQTPLRSNSSSTGSRKGRIKSHRIGRPPGSGLKARLEQEAIQRQLDLVLAEEQENHQKHQQQQPDQHVNHSLLANHPASSRQDHANDDENKPREERSYLEFFPFLTTTVRLEIVDPSETEASVMVEMEDSHPTPSEASASVDIKMPPAESAPSPAQMEIDTEAPIPQTMTEVQQPVPESFVTAQQGSAEVTPQVAEYKQQELLDVTIENAGVANDILQPSDDDMDGASDREVFFDAKGFIEGEADDTQNSTVPQENSPSGITEKLEISGSSEVKIESDAMEVDDQKLSTPHTTTLDTITPAMATVDTHRDQNVATASAQEAEPKAAVQTAVVPIIKISTPAPLPPSSATVLEPKTPMAMLPKSTFRLIPREEDDLEEYHLPTTHNVRYIEPTETELAERVEYDMDEQDEIWLKEINAQRRKQDLGEVTSTMFEKIFDRLEKEWFDLTKNIPKPTENLPPEDSACNICDDGECENSNAIVFCDGCNLAVHQDCYGIPYIPEGQWLCRKCMLSPQMPVSCIFCPGEGGAFKQTNTSRWAHLLCASWIPEVGVANVVYMEPIDNIEKIPSSRWKLTCYICKLRMGACIQCETKNCVRAFHVTCARKAHLYMKSKLSKVSNSGGEVLVYRAHCHKHTPRDYKGAIDIAGAAAAVIANKGLKKKRIKVRALDDDSDDPDYGRSDSEDTVDRRQTSSSDKGSSSGLASSQSLGGSRTSKAALAHQKHYSPGAPLAPSLIVNRLLPFVSKLTAKSPNSRKASAQNFLYTICKYWSLKRESRRGAPLLKRLHLEPWTASASAHRQTEEEKTKKLQTQLLLRGDLEKVRMLAELVRKRERAKLKRQELQNRYLSKIMFPLKTILEDTFIEVEKLDRQKYFAFPISAEEVQDYHDVIKNPISFQTINEKLVGHKYQSVDEFSDDVRLIYQNCLTYNDTDTPYYRSAIRQSKQAEPLLEKAKEDYESLDIDPRTGFLAVPIDPEIFSYTLVPFQKSDDDEENPVQSEGQGSSALPAAADTLASKPKHRRKNPIGEQQRANGPPARMLRATLGRGSQGSSQPSTPDKLPALLQGKPSTKSRTKPLLQSSDQTLGIRTAARLGRKPETPKLKTATLTRADMAKAREQTGEKVELEAEDELLEKLKLKSKKSRSLANSLQSRLKPSIVDKAVVINKPAPKGWAYVVVEGEEDTTEGEDGDDDEQTLLMRGSRKETPSAPVPSLPISEPKTEPEPGLGTNADAGTEPEPEVNPVQEQESKSEDLDALARLEAIKEENRRKGRERALKKKLAKEAKNKDRSEKYYRQKAEKARLEEERLARRARGELVSDDESQGGEEEEMEIKDPFKVIITPRLRRTSGKVTVDVGTLVADRDARTTSKSPPGSPSVTRPHTNGGQKGTGLSPRNESSMSGSGKRKAEFSRGKEQQQELSAKPAESSHRMATKRTSVSERLPKGKRKAQGDVGKYRLEKEDGDANGDDRGEESDLAERSEESEAVRVKEEPPRKRQKKAGLGRSSPPEETMDEEFATSKIRRLRSTEVVPQAANAITLGPRRSSLAGSKGGSTKNSSADTLAHESHQPSAL